jgi:hypothetical protein
VPHFCPILLEIEICRQTVVNIANIRQKFQENTMMELEMFHEDKQAGVPT